MGWQLRQVDQIFSGYQLPMFLNLLIRVCMNTKFLDWINLPPTEYIDAACELAAAVVHSRYIHGLNFMPEIRFFIISLALCYYSISIQIITSCKIYKSLFHCRNACTIQLAPSRRCNFCAYEIILVILEKCSAFLKANICLENLKLVQLTRIPV